MDALRSILIATFGLAIGVVGTILVMTKGWGLEPKSWWWIIVGNTLMQIVAYLIMQVAERKE